MKETVYITGHRNPDTDSIASAVAYAELKNKRGDMYAVPIRIGEINRETRFVLDYFGVEAPAYMDTMAPKIVDLDFDRAYGVSKDVPIKKAMQILQDHHMNSIAVTDNDDKLIGIVSISDITSSYMETWDDKILGSSNTSLNNIVDVLAAEIIYSPKDPRKFDGSMKIFVNDPGNESGIKEGDVVIVGQRNESIKYALEIGVSLMIICGRVKLDDDLLKLAKKNRVTIISTNNNSYMASRLLPQAIPMSSLMKNQEVIFFHLDDFLEDVKMIMKNNRYRTYPVLDHHERVVGSLSRYHLIGEEKKNLILVDHNEKSQTIHNVESAKILEIIDHHRVQSVTTSSPIYFRNMPLGSTATIVSQMFFEQGISPSKQIAGLLCAAIISDTLLFRSPTATETDKAMLYRMSKIAGIDPEEFAMKMFKAGTAIEKSKPTEVLKRDVKLFNIDGEKVRIAQVFTMEIGQLVEYKERLVKRMNELLLEQKEDIYMLIMTDIFKEMSEIIIVGKYGKEIADEFNQNFENNSFIADDVLSRKKQVIPKITSAIAKVKAELE